MAYDSYLYSWSLRGYVPERLVVRPVDQWAGESERGATLCAGELPEAYKGRGAALHDFVFLICWMHIFFRIPFSEGKHGLCIAPTPGINCRRGSILLGVSNQCPNVSWSVRSS